ncbi:MAG TPA: hypothetical protein VLH77_00520 [Gammaproteobacteria bacterium]|nr:hypothetical protein [Gammaproteobacteria bacterium]
MINAMDYSKYKQLEFRRKFWKIFGAEIKVTEPNSEQVVGIIKMKAWKLKEDIRLYSDASLGKELIRIGARSIIDFGATYDVFDSPTNQQLFSLRRKGLKSTFVRDHWDMYDSNGERFGFVQETSSGLALARRWLELLPFGDIIGLIFAFVPQSYTINVNDATSTPVVAGTILHRKNPIIVKMSLDTTAAQPDVDPRIGISVVSLLSVIDSAKNG